MTVRKKRNAYPRSRWLLCGDLWRVAAKFGIHYLPHYYSTQDWPQIELGRASVSQSTIIRSARMTFSGDIRERGQLTILSDSNHALSDERMFAPEARCARESIKFLSAPVGS